jgi:hypothetical protein
MDKVGEGIVALCGVKGTAGKDFMKEVRIKLKVGHR